MFPSRLMAADDVDKDSEDRDIPPVSFLTLITLDLTGELHTVDHAIND